MLAYLIAPNFAYNTEQRTTSQKDQKRIRWNLILFCFAYFSFMVFSFNRTRNMFLFLSFFLSLVHYCTLYIALLGVFGIKYWKQSIEITFSMSCSHPLHFLATDFFVFIVCCCLLSLYYAALHSKLLFHYFHQWHSLLSVVFFSPPVYPSAAWIGCCDGN